MLQIKENTKINIRMTNDISLDGKPIYSRTVTIDSDNPSDISFSELIKNKEACKTYRKDIRESNAKFDDLAYEKQDELLVQNAKKGE